MLHVFMIFNIIFDGVSVPYFYGIMVDCLFVCWNSLFGVCLFVCFFISLFICLFVYLFICREKVPDVWADNSGSYSNQANSSWTPDWPGDRLVKQLSSDMQGQVHIPDTRHAGTGTYIRY